MHPGPINRGVELSHDLADHRPERDPRPGAQRRRAAHGGALPVRRPQRGAAARRRGVVSRILDARRPRARSGERAATSVGDLLIEDGASRPSGGDLAAGRRRVHRRRRLLGRAGLRRPAQPPARAGPGVQGGHRLGRPRRGGGRLHRGRLHGQHAPGERRPGDDRLHPRPRAQRLARCACYPVAAATRGLEGEVMTEMAALVGRRRRRLQRRRQDDHGRRRDAPRARVLAAGRRAGDRRTRRTARWSARAS